MRTSVTAAMAAVIASLCFATPVHAEGISSLIVVSQQRADNANEEALEGADRQRELVNRQRRLRDAQRRADDLRDELAEANERSDAGNGFFGSLFGADGGAASADSPREATRALGAERANSEIMNCRACGVRAAGQ